MSSKGDCVGVLGQVGIGDAFGRAGNGQIDPALHIHIGGFLLVTARKEEKKRYNEQKDSVFHMV